MKTNDLKANIRHLLKERNAIFLAHNYQPPEIQDLADLCGDSLELSIQAARTEADVILFCGVHFMAETAAILSPEKTVLLPRPDAGCPMAEMIDPVSLRARIDELPPMPVVTYVNSSAAVKALSTICCTSANAVAVVESLDAEAVLMTPDRNLARYTAARTKKKVHVWEGCQSPPSRRGFHGAPRMPSGSPGAGRRDHQHVRDAAHRGRIRQQPIHRGDRGRSALPLKKSQPRQRILSGLR